jgi:hypothetical protein
MDIGFNDNSWMFVDPSLSTPFPDMIGASKLDFLATAVQQELTPTLTIRETTLDTTTSESPDKHQHVCRWSVYLTIFTTFRPLPSTCIKFRKQLQPSLNSHH